MAFFQARPAYLGSSSRSPVQRTFSLVVLSPLDACCPVCWDRLRRRTTSATRSLKLTILSGLASTASVHVTPQFISSYFGSDEVLVLQHPHILLSPLVYGPKPRRRSFCVVTITLVINYKRLVRGIYTLNCKIYLGVQRRLYFSRIRTIFFQNDLCRMPSRARIAHVPATSSKSTVRPSHGVGVRVARLQDQRPGARVHRQPAHGAVGRVRRQARRARSRGSHCRGPPQCQVADLCRGPAQARSQG